MEYRAIDVYNVGVVTITKRMFVPALEASQATSDGAGIFHILTCESVLDADQTI